MSKTKIPNDPISPLARRIRFDETMAASVDATVDRSPNHWAFDTASPISDAPNDEEETDFADTVRLLRRIVTPMDFVEDGPRLGRFIICEIAGSGTFGRVFRAWDPLIGRDVALKIPHTEVRENPALRRRFLRESRAAGRLDHPNIARVLDAGEFVDDDGELVPYLATQWIDGTALSVHIRLRGPIPVVETARLIIGLASGLHHAHQQGVLHRDIKPDNILMGHGESLACEGQDSSSRLILTDFGLAHVIDEDPLLSQRGMLIGTPDYMSPEQLSGATTCHGPAVDIYAIGVVLFELVTGQLPDRTNDLVRAMKPIPHALRPICRRCLQPRPDDRYASAADLRDDLIRLVRDDQQSAKLVRFFPARWAAVGLLVLLALFVAGAPQALGRRTSQPTDASSQTVRFPAGEEVTSITVSREGESIIIVSVSPDGVTHQHTVRLRTAR